MPGFERPLDIRPDQSFDQMVLSSVRLGEKQLAKGLTPGEIELELRSQGVDEQIAASAAYILRAFRDHEIAQSGFSSWRAQLPFTNVVEYFTKEAALRISGWIATIVMLVLAIKYGLFLPFSDLWGWGLAAALTPVLIVLLTYFAYLGARFMAKRKASRLRQKLHRLEAASPALLTGAASAA